MFAEITNFKFQAPNEFKITNINDQKATGFEFGNWSFDIVCYL